MKTTMIYTQVLNCGVDDMGQPSDLLILQAIAKS
jgi:hypothetical protein